MVECYVSSVIHPATMTIAIVFGVSNVSGYGAITDTTAGILGNINSAAAAVPHVATDRSIANCQQAPRDMYAAPEGLNLVSSTSAVPANCAVADCEIGQPRSDTPAKESFVVAY